MTLLFTSKKRKFSNYTENIITNYINVFLDNFRFFLNLYLSLIYVNKFIDYPSP